MEDCNRRLGIRTERDRHDHEAIDCHEDDPAESGGHSRHCNLNRNRYRIRNRLPRHSHAWNHSPDVLGDDHRTQVQLRNHRQARLRNRKRLVQARKLVREQLRSKELLRPLHNHKRPLYIRSFPDVHAIGPAGLRETRKDRHMPARLRNRSQRELARTQVQEQVLVRSTERLQPLRNHNPNRSGFRNEHATWQASQPAMHMDQHTPARLRNRSLRPLALARSKVLLRSLRNRNRGYRNEHAIWQASQLAMHMGQHTLARLRSHNRPLPELLHSKERQLLPGKSDRTRREFRVGFDYPSGSTGRSLNRIHSRRPLPHNRNLLQQVPHRNRSPVRSLTPHIRNIPGQGLDPTGRFQSLRCRTT